MNQLLNIPSDNRGFSAVELLITLFIAAIFLIAGYQLWIQVVKAGADSDRFAKASNVAYDYLRRNTETDCPHTSTESIDVDGLSDASIAINITCPYTGSNTPNSVKKVTSTLTYGSPQKEVTHVLFTD